MSSGIFKVAEIVSEEAVLIHTVRILMILMAIAIRTEEIMDLQEVQKRTVEDRRMAIELTVAIAEAEEMLILTVVAGEAVVLTAAAVVVTVTVVMTKIIQVITK